MDDTNLPKIDLLLPDIDTSLPEIDLQGAITMDEARAFIARHMTPEEINSALKANHTTFTEKISIRIPHDVLAALKTQAENTGLGYQTFINLILAEFAAGRLTF